MAEAQSHPSSGRRDEVIANPAEVTEALGPILDEDARALAALREVALETGRSWGDVVLEQLVAKFERRQSSGGIFGAYALPSDLKAEEKQAITSAIHSLAVVFERIERRDQGFDFDAALRFVTFCIDQVRRKMTEAGEGALEAAAIAAATPPDLLPTAPRLEGAAA
jgi:hypothetical protein